MPDPTPPPIGPTSPFFVLGDVARSIEFHRDRLGFDLRDPDRHVLSFGRPA